MKRRTAVALAVTWVGSVAAIAAGVGLPGPARWQATASTEAAGTL